MDNLKSRFASYKARHAGTLQRNEGCEIESVLARLHDKVHHATEQLDKMPDRDQKWRDINCNAQKLLDDMTAKGTEAILTVFVFLSALDQDRTVRSISG
jgi:hypothetical protein